MSFENTWKPFRADSDDARMKDDDIAIGWFAESHARACATLVVQAASCPVVQSAYQLRGDLSVLDEPWDGPESGLKSFDRCARGAIDKRANHFNVAEAHVQYGET